MFVTCFASTINQTSRSSDKRSPISLDANGHADDSVIDVLLTLVIVINNTS